MSLRSPFRGQDNSAAYADMDFRCTRIGCRVSPVGPTLPVVGDSCTAGAQCVSRRSMAGAKISALGHLRTFPDDRHL